MDGFGRDHPHIRIVRRLGLLSAVLTTIAAAGCGGLWPAAPDGVYFPRFEARDSMPAGAVEATLRREGPCVVLRSGKETFLAIWSSQLHAVDVGDGRLGIVAEQTQPVALEGEATTFAGAHYAGEYRQFVESLVGGPIRSECVRADGYFVVTLVSSEPGL